MKAMYRVKRSSAKQRMVRGFGVRVLLLCLLCLGLWMVPWACVVGGQKTCSGDTDCTEAARFCVQGVCAVCREASDCGTGKVCVGGVCLVSGGEIAKESVPQEPQITEDGGEPSLPEQSEEPKKEEEPEGDCREGESRPCFGGDPKWAGVGDCKEGTQVCRSGAWSSCVGDVLPKAEVCDGRDNNCDGQIDETFPQQGQDCRVTGGTSACRDGRQVCLKGQIVCEPNNKLNQEICENGVDDDCDGQIDNGPGCAKFTEIPTSMDDYLVLSNGNIVVFDRLSSSTGPELRCYGADGSVVKASFKLGSDRSDGGVVFRALPAGGFVVAWFQYNPFPSQRSGYLSLFKQDCEPLLKEKVFLSSVTDQLLDIAVNASGQIAVLFRMGTQMRVISYDASGGLIGAETSLVDAGICGASGGGRVALNGKGDGVVLCGNPQGSLSVRLFGLVAGANNDPAWKDTGFQILGDTANALIERHTFVAGINETGEIGIAYQHRNKSQIEGLLLKADGTKLQHLVISRVMESSSGGYDGPHERVEILQGDFVFREIVRQEGGYTRWFRYNAAGTLVSSASSPLLSASLRVGGTSLYLRGGTRIYANAIDLSAGRGLCPGGACACEPQRLRRCYTGAGSRTAASPCKEGLSTCANDGSAWGDCQGETVPVPEICGNGKDDDCDGRVDNDCSDPQITPTLALSDMGIAEDGRVVGVASGERRVWATCWDAAGKIAQGAFAVSEPFRSVKSATVAIAPKSGRFVIAWLEGSASGASSLSLRARLFDGQCRPLTGVIAVAESAWALMIPRVVIDESGRSALLWREPAVITSLRLAFLDASGALSSTMVDPDAQRTCGSGLLDNAHVAYQDDLGWGVIACASALGQIFWRRFSLTGSLLEANYTGLSATIGNHLTSGQGFRVGMNAQGFVVAWSDATLSVWRAQSYGVDAKPRKTWEISKRFSGANAFGFSGAMPRFEGDVVLWDGAPSFWRRFLRYDLDGKLVAAMPRLQGDQATAWLLRSEGKKSVLYIPNTGLRRDLLKLSASAGICNGEPCFCEAGTTSPCYRFAAPGSSPRSPCMAGTRTCAQDGSTYGDCNGEVLPTSEICGNAIDDNCDGRIDDSCPAKDFRSLPANVSNGATDIDANAKKEIFLAFARDLGNDGSLLGLCWDAMGAVRGRTFVIAEAQDQKFRDVQVYASPDASLWAVLWRLDPPTSPQIAQFQLFDSNCQPVGALVEFPTRQGDGQIMAAFGAGNQLLVGWRDISAQLNLSFFDASGNPLGTSLSYEASPRLCGSSTPFRVARNPIGGGGVVVCAGASYTNPYTLRRFNNSNAWIEADVVSIAATQNTRGTLGPSHLLVMNGKSEFVVVWTPYGSRTHEAVFFESSGKEIKTLRYATASTNSSANFPYTADRLGLLGDDFVLHTNTQRSPMQWMRYRADGTLVSTSNPVSTTSALVYTSRFVGTSVFFLQNDRLSLDPFALP